LSDEDFSEEKRFFSQPDVSRLGEGGDFTTNVDAENQL
jgi:hypothetical protein